MATASGQVTNAVFGFTSMLINLLKDHHPDHIAVAFDRPEPTFRHEMIATYKAGRAETPDILRQQMGLVRRVIESLQIPMLEKAGFEADDIIATLATEGRDRGDDVIVVTGDRDAYQLVEDPHVRVLYNRRGVSDYVLYDEAGILERTGVTPEQYPQYAALRGDPSDNLPGVPGVGEKTAAKLINTYGDLDGIFDHLDELSPKLRTNLAAGEAHGAPERRGHAAHPRRAARRRPPRAGDGRVEPGGGAGALQLPRVPHAVGSPDRGARRGGSGSGRAGGARSGTRGRGRRPAGDRGRSRAAQGLVGGRDPPRRGRVVGGREPVDRRSRGWRSSSFRLRATEPTEVVWIGAELLAATQVRTALGELVGSGGVAAERPRRQGADARPVAARDHFPTWSSTPPSPPTWSTRPATSTCSRTWRCATPASSCARPTPRPRAAGPRPARPPTSREEAGRRAAAVARLSEPLGAALSARGLSPLYDDIERPLVRVLARMEEAGIRVDEDYLRTLTKHLTEEARQLETEIQEQAGEPFLVNSTKQLREILFVKLGLAPQKRIKTGFSTDAQSLEKLRGQHPIIESLLRYREVEKLRSTYGDTLLAEVAADGRIHATFNQTVARTGRLSSDQPNLHNIPIRSEEGKEFRRAFIPADGCRFLVADYNQIELRVIAHLAQDPGLIEAFRAGTDIHTTTAARIFGVDDAAVTTAQRSKAKMVSYGLAYGMESYGLAQRLSIPVDEAAQILEAYFEAFPNVRDYMDRVVAEARSRGYTETLFGRRRQIPELQSGNYRIRQAGERQAMNAGIQGLAADIFKVALVRIDRHLQDEALDSRLILQVHDEVILEVPPAEEERAAAMVIEEMTGAASLSVPLAVNLSWGASWADAKG